MTCPQCQGTRVFRYEMQVPRHDAALEWTSYCQAGWYVCFDCWHCWDGVCEREDGVLPPRVVPRPKLYEIVDKVLREAWRVDEVKGDQ